MAQVILANELVYTDEYGSQHEMLIILIVIITNRETYNDLIKQLEKEKKNHGLKGYNNLNPYSYADPTSQKCYSDQPKRCFSNTLLSTTN
jgi:hypothetical protein